MSRLLYTLVKVPLGADIDDDDTSITLAAPLKEFGEDNIATISGDTLTLRCGMEIMHVTAYTSGATTATVLRGQEGSTATAHNEGDILRHVATDLDLGGGGAVDSVNTQTGAVVLDAGDIGITDAGAYFTGTDVEAALQELGAGGGGGGAVDTVAGVSPDGGGDIPLADLVAALGIGVGVVDIAKATRASTSLTLNSTSVANLDTGLDLVVTAQTGDEIEVGMSGVYGNEDVANQMFVATIVSGSPVNYFGSGSSTPASTSAWGKELNTEDYPPIAGGDRYTVQAGDISGGTVTLRLRYKTGTASNLTLFATAVNPLRWFATVYRPF